MVGQIIQCRKDLMVNKRDLMVNKTLINTIERRDQAQCIHRTLLVEIFKNKIIQKLLVARTAG